MDGQKRYLYHLVAKQIIHNKPTYETLRSSFERMRTHAEENGARQLSMPCIHSALNELQWNVVRQLIQDITGCYRFVLYLQKKLETEPSTQATEAVNPIVKAQQATESLKYVRERVRKGCTPQHNDLQGLPRLDSKI